MQHKTVDRMIYVAIALVLVGLMVVGVAIRVQRRHTQEARDKAERLVALLHAQGLPAPSVEEAVAVFGNDGGAAAVAPESAFTQELLATRIANGSDRRPVIVDKDVFRAEQTVLEVYAPQKLPAFRKFVKSLTSADTVPGL